MITENKIELAELLCQFVCHVGKHCTKENTEAKIEAHQISTVTFPEK